ncbi:unnamed protein product, partial [Timema podura]|nr:unnamed protein product [Timema podura]
MDRKATCIERIYGKNRGRKKSHVKKENSPVFVACNCKLPVKALTISRGTQCDHKLIRVLVTEQSTSLTNPQRDVCPCFFHTRGNQYPVRGCSLRIHSLVPSTRRT